MGVTFHKKLQKFQAVIYFRGDCFHLGYRDNEKDAKALLAWGKDRIRNIAGEAVKRKPKFEQLLSRLETEHLERLRAKLYESQAQDEIDETEGSFLDKLEEKRDALDESLDNL